MQLVISSLVTGYGWIGSCWSFQIQSEKFVKSQCHCFLSSSLSSHFQDRVRDWMVRRIHLMHQSKYCRNRQKGMFAFIYVCLFVSTRITYSSFIRERGIPSYNYKKFKLTFAKAKNFKSSHGRTNGQYTCMKKLSNWLCRSNDTHMQRILVSTVSSHLSLST